MNSKTPDSYVAIRGFEIFRCDAKRDVNKHGVCLYVSNALKCTVHDSICPNVIAVHLQDYNLHMMVYLPPSYTTVQNDVLINCLMSFCENEEVILMEDFNLPSLKWNRDISRPTSVDLKFFDCFTVLGLTQWVNQSTFLTSGNILDIVLSSEDDGIGIIEVMPLFPSCSHMPVYFTFVFPEFSKEILQPIKI